jgi:hypothetical protein
MSAVSKREIIVVIPLFRGSRHICECISSIQAGGSHIKCIIVVDNCDSDSGSLVSPDPAGPVPVRILKSAPAVGFGRACNIGMMEAQRIGCEVIVLLNQDCKVSQGSLDLISEQIDSGTFAAFPVSMTYDMLHLNPKYVQLYLARHTALVADLYMGKMREKYEIPHDGANAACVAINSALLQQVGYFDPLIWMYTEERDLFFRAAADNLKLVLVPTARVGHVHANFTINSGADRRKIDCEIRKGHQLFKVKHAPTTSAGVMTCLTYSLKTILKSVARRSHRELLLYLKSDLSLPARIYRGLKHRTRRNLIASAKKQAEKDLGAITCPHS